MIHFLTFSTNNNSRLKYRAIETGWFDNVHFSSNVKDASTPSIILNVLNELNEDDILVYANEFSEINLNGFEIFRQHIENLSSYFLLAASFKDSIDSDVLMIKKMKDSISFLNEWKLTNDIHKVHSKFKDKILLMKPNYVWFYSSKFTTNAEIRLSQNDILPRCKRNYYKPYSMFVAGHVIPPCEIDYDDYTHFINVGKDNLRRCNANTKINIKQYQSLAELTALYWIWKNIDISDLRCIGFSTYRKPFLISNKDAFNILENNEYDCVANRYYSNFEYTHNVELGNDNVNEFKQIVKNILPIDEAAELLNDYKQSKFIYICNSFIIHTFKFNELCEKIFKIVIPIAEQMKNKHGEKDHRPCAGCFAEYITSFYLKKLFKNVFTVPFLIYPTYNHLYNDDIATYNPMIYGTLMNNGEQMFFPLSEHPKKKPDRVCI